jgi:hypothetical protein
MCYTPGLPCRVAGVAPGRAPRVIFGRRMFADPLGPRDGNW